MAPAGHRRASRKGSAAPPRAAAKAVRWLPGSKAGTACRAQMLLAIKAIGQLQGGVTGLARRVGLVFHQQYRLGLRRHQGRHLAASLVRARLRSRRSISSQAEGRLGNAWVTACKAASRLAKPRSTSACPPGSGTVRSVASVNRPSVPSEPTSNRGMSNGIVVKHAVQRVAAAIEQNPRAGASGSIRHFVRAAWRRCGRCRASACRWEAEGVLERFAGRRLTASPLSRINRRAATWSRV